MGVMQTTELVAGPELDALIAKQVMGWQRVELWAYAESGGSGPAMFNTILNGNEVVKAADDKWHESGYRVSRDYGRAGLPYWEPSTDIACAWQVVEQMRVRGWLWEIKLGTENDPEYAGSSTATADVYRRDIPGVVGHDRTLRTGWAENRQGHSMDDVPLAICRAALQAVSA